MDQRILFMQDWLRHELGLSLESITALPGDASNRRYFRVQTPRISYILMDAPNQKESNRAFLEITALLQTQQVNVPHIIAKNPTEGLLLLTDFGDDTLLTCLNNKTADALYKQAIDALLTIQQTPKKVLTTLPNFDDSLMKKEVALFTDWFLNKQLELRIPDHLRQIVDNTVGQIIKRIQEQPYVCCHRDYHSRNLMCSNQGIGIIDYQDAVHGPITYDLVSLLRDCYIDWPLERIHGWVNYYYEHAIELNLLSCDPGTFLSWFDWTGLQRHMKAIGIFARLNLQDHKPGYLKDIPRTLNYLLTVTANYSGLIPLHQILEQRIVPATFDRLQKDYIA